MFRNAILASFLFTASAFAQLPPEAALKSMKVADDLQVELFASEPLFVNPTSIDVDHKGRVWVCEAVNYRQKLRGKPPLRKEGDRIVVLIDKTGEGKATEAVTFCQFPELQAPLGVCVAPYPDGKGQKVFVCQSPHIWVFEDKDGDLKADGPPKDVLKGSFGGIDHDHGVHGVNIGPDGKLYFTVGDQGVKDLQSSDGKGPKWSSNATDCRAGTVWRCEQDGTKLEMIAHNFRNNYECCVDSFGEIWLSDNDDDGNQQTRICHVMPGGNYGYHPRGPGQSHWHEEQPGIVHKTLRTGFGSPTGICFYEGSLLPKRFQGQLLHADAGPREIRLFTRKPKGAGYELDKEVILTSNDNWFRPSDVCVGPDGSVFVADWYDPGVGGHGMGDTTRGRIYRITPKGHKGYKVPMESVEPANLISLLSSPSLATRALAIANFSKLNDSQLANTLASTAASKNDQFINARRLWMERASAIEMSKTLGIDWMNKTTSSTFIRLASRFDPNFITGLNPAEWQSLTSLEKPANRRESLISLKDVEAAKAGNLILELAWGYDGQDRTYLSALNIACGTDQARRDAILADFEKHFPDWNDKVADLVWELRPKSMLPKLGKLIDDPKLTGPQKARIVDILAAQDDPAAGMQLVKLIEGNIAPEAKAQAIKNLALFLPTKWAKLKQGDEIKAMIAKLLAAKDSQLIGLQLAAAAPDCCTFEDIAKIAGEAGLARDTRVEAVRTLGKIRNAKCVDFLVNLYGDAVVGTEAVTATAEQITAKGPGVAAEKAMLTLQKLIQDKDSRLELRKTALGALAGNRVGTGWLLQLQEKGALPVELVADAGKLLRNSPFQGERNKALILFPAGSKLDIKKLPSSAELAKRVGDPSRGKSVLAVSMKGESQCMKCHMVRGIGGQIGPDLSMIGKKGSKENLYDSILQPSKAIADQYIQWSVTTDGGATITGLLMGETETDITIRDANGKDTRIPLKSIEDRKKSTVSLMPDNLVGSLTEQELYDLVEYLMTLKTASWTPAEFFVMGPFGRDVMAAKIDAKALADIGKPQVGADGKPVAWQTVKPNATGYFDLKAHYAPKSDNIASYLVANVESPKDQDGVLLIGHDDEAQVWLNGATVHTGEGGIAAVPEKHQVKVKLVKGVNTILIRIANGTGDHGLYFALTSDEELKAPGRK